MTLRPRTLTLLAMATLAGTCLVSPVAEASSTIKVSGAVNPEISSSMPLVRLSFSKNVAASALPALVTKPALATSWQQIGPRQVQAVVSGPLTPASSYKVELPVSLRCTSGCTFTRERARSASTSLDFAWEQQLLGELKYLPATFTTTTLDSEPTTLSSGFYSWAYPRLPSSLSALWGVGNNNIIVRGALMAFQNNNNLPTSGFVDAATWKALVSAVVNHKVNPSTYNYVTVSEASPETVRLYVGGKSTFHTLANTGISVDPTPLGTFPVYLRYLSQTMSGTNPDGSHYSDPGIPWISYFVGGSALHGFIRSSYGWPQSLGCVEMPFASAHTIWPHTPIGTLVTVETS